MQEVKDFPRRARFKGSTRDVFGCSCGAQMAVEEATTRAGAVLGGTDTARQAWRRLHSQPGCLWDLGADVSP